MNRGRSPRAGGCPLRVKAVSIEEAPNGGALCGFWAVQDRPE
jgi:hypothetical protein